MFHRDLGSLSGSILLFGGAYSNFQATKALYNKSIELGISPNNVIFTGDAVAYCANPIETVALLDEWGVQGIAGNCEKQLVKGALDCGCGFNEGSACDLLSARWYPYALSHMNDKMRNWMAQCPDVISFRLNEKRFCVIHGGFSDISRFIWPNDPDEVFLQEIEKVIASIGPIDGVICGHSGLAFERQVGDVKWMNAGVIGMPQNDAIAQTRYGILDEGGFEIYKLDYDHLMAHDAMIKAGLIQGYHQALLTGYWPSEDVLPASLRRVSLASG